MTTERFKTIVTILGALLLLMLVACTPAEPTANEGAAPTETPTAKPTATAVPTETPTELPTATAVPTEEPTPAVQPESPGVAADISGITWSLVHTIVGGDAAAPPPPESSAFFEIEEGRIAGNSGCNRFSGPVTVEGNNIGVGELALTRMACAEELMTLETAMIELLNNAATYTVTGTTLELQNADGLPLALFAEGEPETQKPDEALTGTVWQWIRYDDTGNVNNIEVADPGAYTLEFMPDGTYAIQADCNGGSGRYTVDGSSLVVEPGVMTMVACGEESLDGFFLSRLGDVVTFVLDEDGILHLNLKMDAGNMVFAPAGG